MFLTAMLMNCDVTLSYGKTGDERIVDFDRGFDLKAGFVSRDRLKARNPLFKLVLEQFFFCGER
mgnify:CR=1 FL=1